MVEPAQVYQTWKDEHADFSALPPSVQAILVLAQKLAKHSLRSTVTLADVEKAILASDDPLIHLSLGDKDLVAESEEEETVNLANLFLETCLDPPSHEGSIHVQWASLDGHVLPGFSGSSILDAQRKAQKDAEFEAKAIQKHVFDPVDPMEIFHSGFSKEHRAYLDHIMASLVHSDPTVRSNALLIMQESQIVNQLLPYLTKWFVQQIRKALEKVDTVRMQTCINLVLTLLKNEHTDLTPFYNELFPSCLSLVLCRDIGPIELHAPIRKTASAAIVQLCRRNGDPGRVFETLVMEQLLRVLNDGAAPIDSQFGALCCMAAFGMISYNRFIKDVIAKHMDAWQVLPHTHPNKQEANECVALLQEMWTMCPSLAEV